MNQQDYTGYIHSTSERAQFGSGQVQSHGQVQSSASGMAVQMLKNKNKPVDLRSCFTDRKDKR